MPLHAPHVYSTYNLIGIDPGLNTTGVAILKVDSRTMRILSVEAFTLASAKLVDRTGMDPEYFTERTIKLYRLKAAIQWVLGQYGPIAVGCESPFYNRLMPMAYGALLEVLNVIYSSIIEYNPNIYFQTVAPLLVKKHVGSGGQKGKLDMKNCLRNLPEIMNVMAVDLESLDEHSIDAISVGYALVKEHQHLLTK